VVHPNNLNDLQRSTPLQGTRVSLIELSGEFITRGGSEGSSIPHNGEKRAIVTRVTFMIVTEMYSPDSTQRFCTSLNR